MFGSRLTRRLYASSRWTYRCLSDQASKRYIKEISQNIYTVQNQIANLKLMNVSHIENLAVRLQELAALWNESSQLSQLKCDWSTKPDLWPLYCQFIWANGYTFSNRKKQTLHRNPCRFKNHACQAVTNRSAPNTTVKALKMDRTERNRIY